MNLHEYQSKELFAKYGIPILRGYPATSPAEAEDVARKLGGDLWVVKAQVHAGGRGKAGGVKLSRSFEEVRQHAADLLGRQLITHQSGPKGLPVNIVYVEEGSNIARELYLSVLIDRKLSQISFIASAAGGMDIEQVAIDTPEKIFTVAIDSDTGVQDFQITELSSGFDLSDRQSEQFANMIDCLYRLFVECDASLIEINPLIVTKSAAIIALDAKISIEENALFRQQRLVELRDISQEDAKEHEAAEHDLNYVSLDGNIACMVNGAGLAMATMDLIKLHGGEPANFLDVGGDATSERAAEAFKLILSNKNVAVILVNIFGGIVRCDMIAQGIISAVREIGVSIPVVVRLEGTNVIKGRQLLESSGLDIISADDLTDAAKKAVAVTTASGNQ
ncbi:ADP-forming succinate--CoA ligase subunit beta [Woeseiaceae bacterium]|nr:ADP-forming succinate--CoA ligase subunit beta [Woeseiaceae bacterium]